MAQPKIIRRDISNDPEALLKVVSAPEFRPALLDCGFTNIGFLETSAPGLNTRKQLEEWFSVENAAFIFDRLENGEAYEIMGSSDKTSFAVVDNHFGELILSFLTIAEDGALIDTTMKPTRAPQASQRITGVPQTTLFNLFSQIGAKLRKLERGMPPLWPRSNRPQAGYHLELTETRDPKYLWRRHQSRLREVLKTNQGIPPHDNLNLYLCAAKRSEHITEYIGKWRWALHLTAAISSGLIVGLLMLEESLVLWLFLSRNVFDMRLLFLNLLLVPPLQYLGYALIREIVLPVLPGPKLEDVSTLMGEITPV